MSRTTAMVTLASLLALGTGMYYLAQEHLQQATPQNQRGISRESEHKQTKPALENIVEVKDAADLNRYLRGGDLYRPDRAVMVEFYADYCLPCKKIEPKIKEIAKEYGDKLLVVRIYLGSNRKEATPEAIKLLEEDYAPRDKKGNVVSEFRGHLPNTTVLDPHGNPARDEYGITAWAAEQCPDELLPDYNELGKRKKELETAPPKVKEREMKKIEEEKARLDKLVIGYNANIIRSMINTALSNIH